VIRRGAASAANDTSPGGFRHEALLYAGADDFAARALPTILHAVEAGEAVLVAVDRAKIQLLRERLGGSANAVAWTDIRGIGGNPARIIPLWRQYVIDHGGRGRFWGFGEPVWPGRSAAEMVEVERHEELLNLAFADADGFTLLCPYDANALSPDAVHRAHHNHPFVTGAEVGRSGDYPGLAALAGPFRPALAEAPHELPAVVLHGVSLTGIGAYLDERTSVEGPLAARMPDLVLAVAAVADSLGRPGTRLCAWHDEREVLAELSELAPVGDPLAGREWPPPAGGATRGLWLANQLCDLVQLRSFDTAATVRLHLRQ
jgi:hypothetical protein